MAEQVSRRPANVSAALIGLLVGVICVAALAVYMIVGVSTTPQEGLGALIAGVWVALGLYGWIQWAGAVVSAVILVSVVLLWVGRSEWWL